MIGADASKKLRLNPTIIDLIFWRSYFQMRARGSGADATNCYKNWLAHERFNNQTYEAVNPMLQIATKIGLYSNDRKFERTNSGTSCYKLLQKMACASTIE